jgi:serine/threonine protein kinase
MKPLAERLAERELISRGDLSLAFRARDSVLDRPVFVKCLNPALASDPEIRARFEREAKAVARLDHPNLVRIYEYGEDPVEGLFMLLEWLEGETLAQRIARGERFGGAAFHSLALQLLRALNTLHGVGILHRDLKPENILVRSDGSFKITDFSLAALRDAPKLTHHEAIIGTPAYMSPEQAAGGAPDERSDLFSLGVVLWEAVTGKNPFAAATVLDTLRRVREFAPDFSHSAIQALPEEARDLLHHLLEKNPDQRPASARATLSLLGEPIAEPKAKRRMTTRDVLHLSAGLAVIGIWAVLVLWQPWKKATVASVPLRSRDRITAPQDSTPQEAVKIIPPTPPQEKKLLAAASPAVSAPVEKFHELRVAPPPVTTVAIPDTAELNLNVEPWAHVFLNGIQVGTTPLPSPLRLPRGKQELELRNPAFPAITVPLDLANAVEHKSVRLADYATLVRVAVEPWGEIYVDGEHAGTTPLAKPLWVSPGRHSLRITHPKFPPVQQELSATAGDTLTVDVNLITAHALVKGTAQ